jgi:hypothetical protein
MGEGGRRSDEGLICVIARPHLNPLPQERTLPIPRPRSLICRPHRDLSRLGFGELQKRFTNGEGRQAD